MNVADGKSVHLIFGGSINGETIPVDVAIFHWAPAAGVLSKQK